MTASSEKGTDANHNNSPVNHVIRRARTLPRSGPVASSLDDRVRELETELLRVTRERDVLKKALAIFGRNE